MNKNKLYWQIAVCMVISTVAVCGGNIKNETFAKYFDQAKAQVMYQMNLEDVKAAGKELSTALADAPAKVVSAVADVNSSSKYGEPMDEKSDSEIKQVHAVAVSYTHLIVEIYGPESSGKTTLTLHIVAEAQKKGGKAAFIDAEHALDPVYARNLGVQVDDLLVSQPDTGEQALEICDMLARSAALDVIVIDSVAALVPVSYTHLNKW